MKLTFRKKSVDALAIYRLFKGSPNSLFSKEFSKLSKDEKSILLAMVGEDALEVISDGIYIAAKTDILQISSVLENALLDAGLDQAQTFIPLFFSFDLTNTKSDYLTDKKTREQAFKVFSKLIEKKGLQISQLKEDFKYYHFNDFCYYSVKKDFLRICEINKLEEVLVYEKAKKDVNEENKNKLSGLFIGLIIGGFFGPLGYIHANSDSGSVKSPKQERDEEIARPWMNIGVTLAIILWICFFTLA